MLDIRQTMLEYAARSGHKFTDKGNGKYLFDFAFNMKDGKTRYQYVWVWILSGRARGKDCVYFSSRVATFDPTVNLYNLFKDSGRGNYSSVTIVSDTDKEGNPCESIVVHASPIHEYLSEAEFLNILWEVGENADILEEKYFDGIDKN